MFAIIKKGHTACKEVRPHKQRDVWLEKRANQTPNDAIKSGLSTSKVFQADKACCTNLDPGCGNHIFCTLSPANDFSRERG